MNNKKIINNIFSIGYRCNTDIFIDKYLKIRKYSSPFSYMVIDLDTSLFFIDNNFNNFITIDYLMSGGTTMKEGKNLFTFNKIPWRCIHIHKKSNISLYDINNKCLEILKIDRICAWNHHELWDNNTRNSIKRRINHFLNVKNETTLLLYIAKIQKYNKDTFYFNTNIFDKYNYKFLLLIPLLDLNSEPIIYCNTEKVTIILFKSNLDGWSVSAEGYDNQSDWENLTKIINTLYDFKIKNRNLKFNI